MSEEIAGILKRSMCNFLWVHLTICFSPDLHVGIAGQNMNLVASSLGLGMCLEVAFGAICVRFKS